MHVDGRGGGVTRVGLGAAGGGGGGATSCDCRRGRGHSCIHADMHIGACRAHHAQQQPPPCASAQPAAPCNYYLRACLGRLQMHGREGRKDQPRTPLPAPAAAAAADPTPPPPHRGGVCCELRRYDESLSARTRPSPPPTVHCPLSPPPPNPHITPPVAEGVAAMEKRLSLRCRRPPPPP